MSDILIRASLPGASHWGYDDPSGVAEPPLAVQLPEALRDDVERAAAREGMSPSTWLLALVSRNLLPTTWKTV
jgi:hypothetical protein